MFNVGDIVTLHSSNGKIVGYVTQTREDKFVWVRWFQNDHENSVVYSTKSIQKVS